MPNPGRMAMGAVLTGPDGSVHQLSQPLPGTGCNNEAELRALQAGLLLAQSHGARSVLRAAQVAQSAGKQVQGVRWWALQVQGRSNHNKATCALANKLARICYATLRDHKPFDEAAHLSRKENRQSFVMPA